MGANSLAGTGKEVDKIDGKGITMKREKRTGYRYTAN